MESINIISKKVDANLDRPSPHFIKDLWDIVRIHWPWPWFKNAEPGEKYRIEVLSDAAAIIAIEIERLLIEKEKKEL